MNKLLREPLVHFLMLGAALFALFSVVDKRSNPEPETIVVTRGQIEHLATVFARTWQRPPTTKELEGMIRDFVRQEVYYREALARGLDHDDIVIRRRLEQKLEFVSADLAALTEPTDADLNEFLRTHPDKFRVEQHVSFHHVYLNPERHGESLRQDAAKLLMQLQAAGRTANVATLGDPFLLAHHFDAMPNSEIAKLFGEQFAGVLNHLRPGEWEGPVASGYGAHLVLVSERTEGRVPALAEVRDAVRREWLNAQRQKANEDFYQSLLSGYTVIVEHPQVVNAEKELTGLARL